MAAVTSVAEATFFQQSAETAMDAAGKLVFA
jgi:hypothetical protein